MKKMNNKGFSMVELIIVIAIMAILAGALAPTLIKYINQSRRSSDVSNAQTIATSIQSALANQEANDSFQAGTSGSFSGDLSTLKSKGASFSVELGGILGSVPSVKYTKDLGSGAVFYVVVESGGTNADKVEVYAAKDSNGTSKKMLYPSVDPSYQ